MKNNSKTKTLVTLLSCLLIAIAGCCVQIGCGVPLAKYERTVRLSAPLPADGLFAAQTHNGYITITGADVADCNLTATIIARAGSQEKAKKLAEQTKVTLQTAANKLTAKIEKPLTILNQSVSVSLDVIIPSQAGLQLTTHNGDVKITNVCGRLNATTHNGRVTASQICGKARFRTHNGSITCKQVSGDVHLRTHNGNIRAVYSDKAAPVCNVSMVTHNGGVDFTAPPNLSAAVDVSTHNGSIKTDLPIAVIGKIGRRKLTGKIGTGEGKLYLETHNGSIKIR